MVDASKMKDASPWHPMDDPVDIKHIGKALEELGEAVSALARALIQGMDEAEPETGKINRDWVQDEFADVKTGIELITRRWDLDRSHMSERQVRKTRHLQQWHNLA